MDEMVKDNWENKTAKYLGYLLEILLILLYLAGGFSFLYAAPQETKAYWGYFAVGIFLIMQAVFGRYSVVQIIENVFHGNTDKE